MRSSRILRLSLFIPFISAVVAGPLAFGQSGPRTTAETSAYTATSTYAEVMDFIGKLRKLSPLIRVETIAVSAEGRDIPLLVIGKPLPSGPKTGDKRIPIYIQANIHAGEVEGKEAVLMLVRDILLDPKLPGLDRLVLLVAPIFNADGNDKMDPGNRPGQIGPEKGSGVRPNGQNLDLNRDAMKLESPEMKGLVKNVLLRWDPVLMVDCHTTDGSYHDEPVTYSWQICPNGDPALIAYARDRMLPEIDGTLEKKYGVLSVPYGDPVDPRDMEKGWSTFGPQPRFATNYIGVRNRFTILDENYDYADFRIRVNGCYYFLKSILEYCRDHSEELARMTAEADRKTVERGASPSADDVFGVEMEARPLPEKITILGYEMEPAPPDGSPFPRMRPTDRKKTYVLPYYADFFMKRTVRRPYAYIIPLFDEAITGKLLEHGIVVEKLAGPAELEVETFMIQDLKASPRLNQGHRTNKAVGTYSMEKKTFPTGSLVVRLAQPLGNLAACILEPESDDGLLVWNFLDRYLAPQWGKGFLPCPVYRLLAPAELRLKPVR